MSMDCCISSPETAMDCCISSPETAMDCCISSPETAMDCCICLEDMTNESSIIKVCTTHFLHKQCFIEYIIYYTGQNNVIHCPLCRGNISNGNMIRIHLMEQKRALKREISKKKVDKIVLVSQYWYRKIIPFKDPIDDIIFSKSFEYQSRELQKLECEYTVLCKLVKQLHKLK